jgi:hypothetical protein
LPEAIARFLGGDAVRLAHRLTRVVETANGRYNVTFERAGGVTEVTADFVVLALPFAVLDELDISRAGFDALNIKPSPNRDAVTTASCTFSTPSATGLERARGRAYPMARATPTRATR